MLSNHKKLLLCLKDESQVYILNTVEPKARLQFWMGFHLLFWRGRSWLDSWIQWNSSGIFLEFFYKISWISRNSLDIPRNFGTLEFHRKIPGNPGWWEVPNISLHESLEHNSMQNPSFIYNFKNNVLVKITKICGPPLDFSLFIWNWFFYFDFRSKSC